jgi:hypothetical protein
MRFSEILMTAASQGGRGYLPEASALFARMTSQPDGTRKGLINALISSLISGGMWSKLDMLHVTAAHDEQAACRNWVADAYNLTAVSSPTFTTDRGFASDGAASYLDTGFQPGVSAGSKALQDDNHFGLWIRNNVSGSGIDAGSTNHTINANNAGNLSARNMAGTSDTVALSVNTSVGHTVHSRSASATYSRYKDGLSLGDATRTSASPNALNLFLCCRNASGASAFSTREIAVAHAGSALSAGEVSSLRTALNTYLTAIGAA